MAKNKYNINDKEKALVDEYMVNGYNGQMAHQKVYPGTTMESSKAGASRMLARPYVKKYLELSREKLANKVEINREWLVKEYLELIKSCKMNGTDGTGYIKDKANWNKSLKQLAKLLGLDEPDQIDVKHNGIIFNMVKPVKKEDKDNTSE